MIKRIKKRAKARRRALRHRAVVDVRGFKSWPPYATRSWYRVTRFLFRERRPGKVKAKNGHFRSGSVDTDRL